MRRFLSLTALTVALALPAGADPPGAPWITADIGKPPISGSTDVGANDVWSLTGSGVMRWGFAGEYSNTKADKFHTTYQRVKGDASITARFLGANFPAWVVNNGLMIRADDTPGSPNVYYWSDLSGLSAQARLSQSGQNRFLGRNGPSAGLQRGLTVRLQRADNAISGFYSNDDRLWFPDFGPVSLPTLTEEALFGLLVNSDRNTLTARWDQVRVETGAVLVPGLKSRARNGKVLLEWRRLKDAMAYNVYRGPSGATRDQLLQVNTDRVAETSFTDNSPGLVNGARLTYAVAAVFPGGDGTPVEGPLAAVQATPVAVPGEWAGGSLNYSTVSGGAEYDAVTDTFTLRGPGWGDTDLADTGYFLSQRIEGDTQITARLLARPSGMEVRQAGLMIREGLDAGARQMRIGFAPEANPYNADGKGGLHVDQRIGTDVLRRFKRLLLSNAVPLPILLRLTRQGDTITAAYSLDDSKTFEEQSYTFTSPLDKTLYVGLYVSAGHYGRDRTSIGRAQFSGVVFNKP